MTQVALTLPDDVLDLIAERVAARAPASASLPADQPAVLSVPALLSIATVAGLLDLSATTVRRRIASGALPAVLDHCRMMVRADELRAYVDQLDRYRVAGARCTRPPRAPAARSDSRYDFLIK
jgi:hypothetical protein